MPTSWVKRVDMGGLTIICDGLRVGATKPGQAGSELTGTEIAYLDGLTIGTVTASKAIVVDASKDLTGLNDVTIEGDVNLSGGSVVAVGSVQEATSTSVVGNTSSVGVLSLTGGLNVVTNTNDANDYVDLPVNVAADVGKRIRVFFSEGCEVRSADASATVNGVIVGATNEAAFAANSYAEFQCVADNTWTCQYWIANGTPTALIPDAV